MALLFRVQRVLLLLALALSPPEAWPQEQNRTLLTGTIGTHSELRTADLALEARQHIEVTTDSSRISGLDVFVHDARSHELLARSEDQSREPFHWDVNQSGRFYLILRNITDTPIAYSVRSSAPRAVYHATVSPESATVEIFYATDRVTLDAAGSDQVAFGSEPADKLHLGTCKVSIPRDHRMGELEGPSILRLEFRNDPAKHIVLVETKIEQPGQFFRQVSERMAHSKAREALVFVHGFNTDFERAARRTAQLAYDLGFDGAPILYSWPS
jgi:hypothetical protein